MSTDPPARQRRRPYAFPGRQKRLFTRFTDDEYRELAAAAGRCGLTPSGFCAQAALDVALNLHTGTAERMEHEALGNLQAELFQARAILNQLRAELADARHDRRTSAGDLDKAIADAADRLAQMDGVISRIHRRLAQQPTDETGVPQPRSTESAN